MNPLYMFQVIINTLPREQAPSVVESKFYVENNVITSLTDNTNYNYSRNVLKVGDSKYAYIFRDTTPSERAVRKYIIQDTEETNEVENI